PSTSPNPCPARPTTQRHLPKPRLRKSWSTPVAGSGTKATKVAREWSPPERSHPAENSANRQRKQRRNLGIAGTHRTTRRSFQVMADLSHRLPPPLRHLPRSL